MSYASSDPITGCNSSQQRNYNQRNPPLSLVFVFVISYLVMFDFESNLSKRIWLDKFSEWSLRNSLGESASHEFGQSSSLIFFKIIWKKTQVVFCVRWTLPGCDGAGVFSPGGIHHTRQGIFFNEGRIKVDTSRHIRANKISAFCTKQQKISIVALSVWVPASSGMNSNMTRFWHSSQGALHFSIAIKIEGCFPILWRFCVNI